MSEAASALSGSVTTLRRWQSSGKLVGKPTAGGFRRYDLAKLKPEISVRKQMANARISSHVQKDHLKWQAHDPRPRQRAGDLFCQGR
ncbi:MAG: hypothetical protein P3X23_007315 [Thermosynechococcus sp. Uc]|uniref:hypothetical protein n=1 Tax=Thermosynechococcus sp. Uc TaxID=3034853 RepID=UPI00259E5372|nr:hypothetical protein [Thermosynechococcus sp. Uc]MDM7326904.1 hypothetical protein [Thermosynechococcus sp. Uc]